MRGRATRDHGEGLSEVYPRPGSHVLSNNPSDGGFFGYMFKKQEMCELTLDEAVKLSTVMTGRDVPELPIAAEDAQENPNIPAGYTFLGQFIDHDVTFEATSYIDRLNDAAKLPNMRTPAFDLDSVYGAGPDDEIDKDCFSKHPEHGWVLLRAGTLIGGGAEPAILDFARNQGKALIPDLRNDENRIVGQIHGAVIAFHNRMIEELSKRHSDLTGAALYERAKRETSWHYQWVVLWDYLARICGGTIEIESHLGEDGATPSLPNFGGAKKAYMPVEFSAAAFRFAHSMIRPAYLLNRQVPGPRIVRGNPGFGRIPVFQPRTLETLEGNRPPFSQWSVEWNYFFPFSGSPVRGMPGVLGDRSTRFTMTLPGPQLSYLIDHELSPPLSHIPDPPPKGHSTVKQTCDAKDAIPANLTRRINRLLLKTDLANASLEVIKNLPWTSLAFLDLMRGRALGLPSGQFVAERLGVCKLSPEEVQIPDATPERQVPSAILKKTPLFFYILREADVREGGRRLGPVGRKMLAEVFVGLLWYDTKSFLRVQPTWQPWVQGTEIERFTMSHFLKFAYPELPDPI